MTNLKRALPAFRLGLANASPLLAVWVMVLATMPVVQWAAGHGGFVAPIILGVLLQASLVVLFLAQATGIRQATRIVLGVAGAAWLAESVGAKTGIPFGAYRYTEVLQPQALGVPLVVPLAWLMMLPPAWTVAQRLTRQRSGFAFVVASALAFTAWDLFLDPQMVGWGLWAWHSPGPYFGVPLANFAGWLLVSAAITALVRPPALQGKPLLVVYTLTWLLEAIGQFLFWGFPGPARFGALAMGAFVVAAWRREVRGPTSA